MMCLYRFVFMVFVFQWVVCHLGEATHTCKICKDESFNGCKSPRQYLKDFNMKLAFKREPPELHCKEHNLMNLKWNGDRELVYFLEINEISNINKSYSILINCHNYTIKNLTEDTNYRIRLWSVSLEEDAIVEYSDFLHTKTPFKDEPRESVEYIKVKDMALVNMSYQALVEWKTTQEKNCYFDMIWFGGQDMADYKQLEFKEPSQPHEVLLKNLKMGSNYSIAIMVTSKNSRIESNKTWIHFTLPTCLDSLKTLDFCAPTTPEKLDVEENLVEVLNDRTLYDLKLSWMKPKYEPDYYTLHLITVKPGNSSVIPRNISGNSTETVFSNVELGSNYQVSVTAWSKGGRSNPAFRHRLVNTNKAAISSMQSWTNVKITLAVVCPIIAVLTALILVIYINNYLAKKSRAELRCKYFTGLEQNVPNTIEENTLEETDEWEIDPEKLLFQTVLGEGAFGIVRRAWLDVEGKEKMEVAIKMLKDSPTQEELREFHSEIEIMKMVGSHPHLVSMIGCITTARSEGPLLVVEYCARGDLQTFLRSTWERVTNQSAENHLRYINLPGSGSPTDVHFTNKLYDMEKTLIEKNFIIQATDLLSYARQVALGMEYLSGLRVLHRDLAARNVLVCGDCRTIKISDFGLSRDVYQNNVYCKSGTGKLPIRWMALESMTHQRYTTHSDVWSFGILMWEIVTLGGNPYPGVNTHDLLPMLKQGYRMEKPVNCSDEVYSIMMQCWNPSPKDRPSFSELSQKLDSLLEKDAEYVNLNVNEPIEYSSISESQLNVSLTSEGYVKPITTK